MIPTVYFTLEWNKKLFTFLKSVMGNNFKFPHHKFLPNDLTINDFGKNPDTETVKIMCRCLSFGEIMKINESKLKNKINWNDVIFNPNTTIEMIFEHPEIDWNMYWIYCNANLTFKHVLKYPNHFTNWILISELQNLTQHDILDNLDLPWDWDIISCSNNNFVLDFVEKHPEFPWNYEKLTICDWITFDFIEKHIDLPWDYNELSMRDNLPMEFVMKHMDKPWNWNEIFKRDDNNACFFDTVDCEVNRFYCRNESDNFKLLFETNLRKITINNPHFSSICKDLTINMVLNNIDLKWDWYQITIRDFVTMDVIRNNPDLPWNYKKLYEKNWKREQTDYANTQLYKLLLLSIYETYETSDEFQFMLFDYIFHDNYLLKTISKFL